MTAWQVVEIIISIAGLISLAVPLIRVIQKNTDAINSLTKELKDLTINNKTDHDHFFSSINKLNIDVELLKEKHRKDN